MSRHLTVVIPSRTVSNLIPCLSNILANENPYPRVVVVDDGLEYPNSETRNFVRSHAHVVCGAKPFVFSRNCNIGIRVADDDDVILLNDDALLKTHSGFRFMQIVADAHPEFGVVSAASNNVGNVNMHPKTTHDLREDPRMVCFVCVLIPRTTIRSVGELDERFVHYGMDDDDYCLRVRNAGLKIGIYDGCRVDHGSLVSTFRGPAGAGGNYFPNLERFKQKWGMDNHGRVA